MAQRADPHKFLALPEAVTPWTAALESDIEWLSRRSELRHTGRRGTPICRPWRLPTTAKQLRSWCEWHTVSDGTLSRIHRDIAREAARLIHMRHNCLLSMRVALVG
jgi:hypothetical protein